MVVVDFEKFEAGTADKPTVTRIDIRVPIEPVLREAEWEQVEHDESAASQGLIKSGKIRDEDQEKVDKFLNHVNGAYQYDEETGETVKLQPEEGFLHLVRANGLKQADMYDGSDPYAIVYWNELEIGRTPVFEDSCDPEFKAKYSIRVPLSEVKSNVLRVELFDFDDSALDDDPDFMGQIILEGQGSEALPRAEVIYPLTKKMEYEGWVHTANRSYKNPYNEAVGGKMTLRYTLLSDENTVVRKGVVVPQKKTLADSRAPHVSAPPLNLSYCKITSPDEIVAAAKRQDPPVPQWSAETMRTLKLRMKKHHARPKKPRHGFDRSNFTVVSQEEYLRSLREPESEPEPEPEPAGDAASKGGGGRVSTANTNRSGSPVPERSAPDIHPKLEAVVEDAFVRIFEFLQTEKLTTVHFFHAMDKDNSGTVNSDEFTSALEEMGMQLTKAERRLCIAKLDVDGDGSVDLKEFVKRMAGIRRRQLAGKDVSGFREQTDADDPIEVVDGINLKNNELTHLEGLGPALCPFLLCNLTQTLQWLDLSFNQLTTLYGEKTIVKNTPAGKTETIEITVPLSDLTNLAILNLHCNKFSEMKTLAPLAKLTRLEKLTLHGNPMEESVPNYRPRILALVPWLRQLDYITVTAKDKEAVKQFREARKRKGLAKAAGGEEGGGGSAVTRTFAQRSRMNGQKTMLGRRK